MELEMQIEKQNMTLENLLGEIFGKIQTPNKLSEKYWDSERI